MLKLFSHIFKENHIAAEFNNELSLSDMQKLLARIKVKTNTKKLTLHIHFLEDSFISDKAFTKALLHSDILSKRVSQLNFIGLSENQQFYINTILQDKSVFFYSFRFFDTVAHLKRTRGINLDSSFWKEADLNHQSKKIIFKKWNALKIQFQF